MTPLEMTLAGDGPSDSNLLPIINWLMKEEFPDIAYRLEFISHRAARGGVSERVKAALKLFPCDILLVHRDAENQSHSHREKEIFNAVQGQHQNFVKIIPIRMTEAWLLSSVPAIRSAAKNPNGNAVLSLPPVRDFENCVDPKADLHTALISACGLGSRRRNKFDLATATKRVAELTSDFSCLRALDAFSRFESEITQAIVLWKSLK
jgi:hypothetical protein